MTIANDEKWNDLPIKMILEIQKAIHDLHNILF